MKDETIDKFNHRMQALQRYLELIDQLDGAIQDAPEDDQHRLRRTVMEHRSAWELASNHLVEEMDSYAQALREFAASPSTVAPLSHAGEKATKA